ncbi:hypothetical protein Dimus_011488 [Dionaea muscipula]
MHENCHTAACGGPCSSLPAHAIMHEESGCHAAASAKGIPSMLAGKRSKRGRRFGFVRYDCPVAADVAIQKTNEVWIQDKELMVKYAEFGSERSQRDRGVQDDRGEAVGANRFTLRRWVPKIATKARTDTRVAKEAFTHRKQRAHIVSSLTGTTLERSFVHVVKHGPDGRNRALSPVPTIRCAGIGNGWLHRSLVATFSNEKCPQVMFESFAQEEGGADLTAF